ncbi:MAG: CvpA family protein [Bacteroidaceae bacterium]|nr:CvpA family protein [Bacteroidaceae bacterium]
MALDASSLTFVDMAIILMLAIGLVTGFIRGIIRQAFSLGGLIAGLIIGSFFSKPFSVLILKTFAMSEKTASVTAFILILIVVPLLLSWVGTLLAKLFKAAGLGFMDRILGSAFGLIKFLIVTGLLIQLMEISGVSEKITENSEGHSPVLYEPVRKTTDACLHWAWDKVREYNVTNGISDDNV